MRVHAVLIQSIAVMAVLNIALSALAGPPEVMRDMPGEVTGRVKTWWLDPNVSVTTRSIGPDRWMAIDWFADSGKLKRNLAGFDVYAQSGFVYKFGGGKTTVVGIVGDWSVEVPQKGGPAGYITGIDKTFVDEFHPEEGQIAADIYISGKLANTIGPYVQYLGEDVRVGEDGSIALLTWKTAEKKVAQVIVVGIDGKTKFASDCEPAMISPLPAPDGGGVAVRMNKGDEDRNRFVFYQVSGRKSSLVVAPNAEFATWLPGSTVALMQTSIGFEYRWRLIDWSTGKQLWEVGDFTTRRVPGTGSPVVAIGGYLLFGGLENLEEGQSNSASRRIYAVNASNGRVVAHWSPSPPSQPATDVGRFRKLGEKLYLVTEETVSEINLNDIATKKNGWQ